MIYVLKTDGADGFKVGFVTNLKKLSQRIGTLQTGCPLPLKPVALCAHGDLADEANMHDAMRAWRIFGEWFKLNPVLEKFIEANAANETTLFGVPALPVGRKASLEPVWRRTDRRNLVLHIPSGSYYVRARARQGNPVRLCLGTKDYETAAKRLPELLIRVRQSRLTQKQN